MRLLVAVTLAIAITAAATPLAALAGDPTSTPAGTQTATSAPPATTTTPTATPTIAELRFDITDAAISWQPVPGAGGYTVVATVTALRISAGGVCETPIQQDRRELSINEDVGGDVNELALDLPAVAPDRWFVVLSQVQITASNSQGEPIAAGGGGRVAETCMFLPDEPTPSPARQLPTTGTGAPTTDTAIVLRAMLATAAASAIVLAGMYSVHRRIRQHIARD